MAEFLSGANFILLDELTSEIQSLPSFWFGGSGGDDDFFWGGAYYTF